MSRALHKKVFKNILACQSTSIKSFAILAVHFETPIEQPSKMKFHSAILLSILSLGTLSFATPGHYENYRRDALAEADPYADADADAWLSDYTSYLRQRDAKKKKEDDSWQPKIIGSYKKDTLKCNAKHVCSGEIIV